MNGRIREGETPEERLAAVAVSLVEKIRTQYERTQCGPRGPDYADFRDAFRPFLELELLNARIDEARKGCGRGLTGRVEELAAQMEKLKASLPDGYHLWVR